MCECSGRARSLLKIGFYVLYQIDMEYRNMGAHFHSGPERLVEKLGYVVIVI